MDNKKNLSKIIKDILINKSDEYVFGEPFNSIQAIDNFSNALADELNKNGVIATNDNIA